MTTTFKPQVLIDALDKIQMTHDSEGSWLVAEQALENSGAVFVNGKWIPPQEVVYPEKRAEKQKEWNEEFGDHSECLVCGTACEMLYVEGKLI